MRSVPAMRQRRFSITQQHFYQRSILGARVATTVGPIKGASNELIGFVANFASAALTLLFFNATANTCRVSNDCCRTKTSQSPTPFSLCCNKAIHLFPLDWVRVP